MSELPIAVVILAAGQGTRMKSALPKVLHPLAHRPMVAHLRAEIGKLNPARIVVVTAPGAEAVAAAVHPAEHVVQDPPRGTGHAVQVAMPSLQNFTGDILVLFGDSPLITAITMQRMLARRREGYAVVVLGFRPSNPLAYGRLVTNSSGQLLRIVEAKDAKAEERAIDLCNSGAMAINGKYLPKLLEKLDNKNAKGEFYLTDIIGHAGALDLTASFVEADSDEVLGVNSRAELATAEAALQNRLRRTAMEVGVTLMAPETVFLAADTVLGHDVVIEPHVVFGPGVCVEAGVHIRSFSHLEGCHISSGAVVGPFARLRPGAEIGPQAHIGNFVEVKNGRIEAGAKVNHLSYIGDARVGAKANIGAGTITCNYDGFGKYQTDIGAGAFIGSNSALVAPVKIGDDAIVGAGSTITADVPAGAVAIARGAQASREGAAVRMRERAKGRAAAVVNKKKS